MKTYGTSKEFIQGETIAWKKIAKGVKRKILAYDDNIMLVKVHFEKGGIGPMHDHYHSQVTYVESGEFQLTIGSETKVLKTGDAFYIQPHVKHGATCIKSGVLIDVFSPIREDFMN